MRFVSGAPAVASSLPSVHTGRAPEFAAHVESGQPGTHQIEHHQREVPRLRKREAVTPIPGQSHAVACTLEIHLERLGHDEIVLDDQDACGHGRRC